LSDLCPDFGYSCGFPAAQKEKRKKKKKKKNFANFSKGTALTGRIGAPTDAP